MKRQRGRRGLAAVLVLIMAINFCWGYPWTFSSRAYTERPATVNATNLNVRSGPGTTYSIVTKLSQGTAVTVIGEKTASDGALWYEIRFSGANGAETTGYASKSYIKFPVAYTSDGDFEAHLSAEGFPESYKERLRQLHAQYPKWVFRAQQTNLDWNTAVQNESVVGRNLVSKSSISSWKSTADGAYNWETSSWPGFDSSSWVAASEEIVRYYMDPRNFLDEVNVFQFLLQSYDSESHTAEGLKTMVSGTFLAGAASGSGSSPGGQDPGGSSGPGGASGSGTAGPGGSGAGAPAESSGGAPGQTSSGGVSAPGQNSSGDSGVSLEGPQASAVRNQTEILTSSYGPGVVGGFPSPEGSNSQAPMSGSTSYIDIILNAGAQSGVNPYVLAAMIIQEQNPSGTGGSISGTEAGYEGYYNFFNIEAYASGGLSPVERGLWYASQTGSYERPWNSPEKSILGGSMYYGQNYVRAGQDTFYLKKYNVQGNNLYKHQYMTNVQGAASEASFYAKAYKDEMKQTALEFKIPVFRSMPENPSPKPSIDGSPNNKLSDLSVSGFVLTPTYNRDTLEYDLIVAPSVSNVTVNATAIDSTATVKGAGNISLQSGDNQIKVSVTAQNGSVREYVLHVVRQNNGPTYSEGVGGPQGSSPGGSGGSEGSSSSGGSPQPGGSAGPGVESGAGGSEPDKAPDGGAGSPGQGTSSPGGDAGQTPGGSSVTVIPMGSLSSLAGTGVSMGGTILEAPGQGQSFGEAQPGAAKPETEKPGESQPTGPASQGAQNSSRPSGDINGDGKMSGLDVLKLQRHLLGLEELPAAIKPSADINGDGKINSLDLLLLQKRVLGIE